MFETSNDILNWVLAASSGVLVFFLCWALYYFIASAQRIYRLIRQVERGVGKAESLVDLIREKISSSGTYLAIFGELLKRGIEFAKDRKENKNERDDEASKGKTKKK
ncbi:MAG: hypothetical protein PHE20_02880 [Patescibacteria group bacterium]|nr:hypothetical protein [Patescibacteria group bacterium]